MCVCVCVWRFQIAVVAVMCKPHRCPHIAMTGNICVWVDCSAVPVAMGTAFISSTAPCFICLSLVHVLKKMPFKPLTLVSRVTPQTFYSSLGVEFFQTVLATKYMLVTFQCKRREGEKKTEVERWETVNMHFVFQWLFTLLFAVVWI